jgi:hypothetical protein
MQFTAEPLVLTADTAAAVTELRAAARAAAEASRAPLYAAYSLRSGFATSAARANKSEAAIMRQGRWKSIPVARRYIRAGSRWHDHAGARHRMGRTATATVPAMAKCFQRKGSEVLMPYVKYRGVWSGSITEQLRGSRRALPRWARQTMGRS